MKRASLQRRSSCSPIRCRATFAARPSPSRGKANLVRTFRSNRGNASQKKREPPGFWAKGSLDPTLQSLEFRIYLGERATAPPVPIKFRKNYISFPALWRPAGQRDGSSHVGRNPFQATADGNAQARPDGRPGDLHRTTPRIRIQAPYRTANQVQKKISPRFPSDSGRAAAAEACFGAPSSRSCRDRSLSMV